MKQKIDPIAQAMQILQMVTERRNQQARTEQGQRELDLREQAMSLENQRAQALAQAEAQRLGKELGLREQDLMFRKQESERAAQDAALKRAMDLANFNRQYGLEEKKLSAEEAQNKLLAELKMGDSQTRAMSVVPELLNIFSGALMTPTVPELAGQQQQVKNLALLALERMGLQAPNVAAPSTTPNINPAAYGQ